MRKQGEQILQKLNEAGHEAYFAGGCVRDEVLGRIPKDYDITTSATPDQVEALFEHTIPTGKDYGTITVMMAGEPFEVTTYRLESDYDGRRPKAVKFGHSLVEDLARRDFTMNAMAMGLDGVLIDPFSGQSDLNKKVIRFVGKPEDRIREDKLRVLRYVRFMTCYGFSGNLADLQDIDITGLSAERIRDEFNKMIMSDRAATGIRMLLDTGLLIQFMPELIPMLGFNQHHPCHSEDVLNHTLTVLGSTSAILELRLAALFHDSGKPATFSLGDDGIGHFYGHQKISQEIASAIMSRLRYSSKQIETVSILTLHHMRMYEHVTEVTAKRLIQAVGYDYLPLLFELQKSDTQACLGDREPHVAAIDEMATLCRQVIEKGLPLKTTDLALNGHHLMALGLVGSKIGDMQRRLLDDVIEGNVENSQEALGTQTLTYMNEKNDVNPA